MNQSTYVVHRPFLPLLGPPQTHSPSTRLPSNAKLGLACLRRWIFPSSNPASRQAPPWHLPAIVCKAPGTSTQPVGADLGPRESSKWAAVGLWAPSPFPLCTYHTQYLPTYVIAGNMKVVYLVLPASIPGFLAISAHSHAYNPLAHHVTAQGYQYTETEVCRVCPAGSCRAALVCSWTVALGRAPGVPGVPG